MKKISIALLILIIFSFCSCKQKSEESNEPNSFERPYVVILSMDGFKWNYADLVNTPNFDKIEQIGVRAQMQASFPTKTFPNHYTIATGLYPDHHGIVNNTFWDPQRKALYQISDRSKVQDGYFYGGEPMWVTAEKQDVISASYFWVGSEAKIDGYYPSIWKVYDHNFSFYQRADSVISWLQLPEDKRPHIITWYVNQPDSYGHKYGPNSDEIKDTIVGLDKLLGYFMDKLSQIDIANKVNVIVTADHGMEEIVQNRSLSLSDYINTNWVDGILGGNPTYNIWAKNGFKDSVENALSKVPHIKYYSSSTIPERFHYMSNARCGDFVAIADSSWALFSSSIPNFDIGGTHGYDNSNTNMDAIFYAYGPAFKENYHSPRFENVDIYNLICKILNLNPAQNDGNIGRVEGMLIKNTSSN